MAEALSGSVKRQAESCGDVLVAQAVTVALQSEDLGVVHQPMDHRRGHLLVADELAPGRVGPVARQGQGPVSRGSRVRPIRFRTPAVSRIRDPGPLRRTPGLGGEGFGHDLGRAHRASRRVRKRYGDTIALADACAGDEFKNTINECVQRAVGSGALALPLPSSGIGQISLSSAQPDAERRMIRIAALAIPDPYPASEYHLGTGHPLGRAATSSR